nr:MAG TPA: hypothetical protein [Caudoviricetes sp.]
MRSDIMVVSKIWQEVFDYLIPLNKLPGRE